MLVKEEEEKEVNINQLEICICVKTEGCTTAGSGRCQRQEVWRETFQCSPIFGILQLKTGESKTRNGTFHLLVLSRC